MSAMRVCVFGAGAIGGHIAARLARGGAEVSLVARGAHLEAIRTRGLLVRAKDGEHLSHPRASADPRELGPQDAVVVTVKAPALPQMAASIAPLLGPETPVAFVMNGIPWWYFDHHGGKLDGRRLPEVDPGDAVRQAVGIERTIGGVVYSACTVVEPGVVVSEHANIKVILGEPDGRISNRAQALAGLLAAGGMPCPVVPDIRTEVWGKLMGNLANGPLCIASRRSVMETLEDPALRAAAIRMTREAIAIAAAYGCEVKTPPEDRVARMVSIAHKPSILQDLELGRPMEIDALLAVPLALARLAGVETPTLDMMIALAKHAARAAGLYGSPA
jgi:2-dehydropantoate 2-reductase